MSYARLSEGDVYVYEDAMTGGILCWGCGMAWSRSEMLAHLEWHVAMGDKVPERAFVRLREEIASGLDACEVRVPTVEVDE